MKNIKTHMNNFSDSRYSGSQVFYASTKFSKSYAESMQSALCKHLSGNNKRTIKRADGIYLMQHINKPGILVECGFLSNTQEEKLLQNENYQEKKE